jgi:lysophospholipase L1-like esterase/Ca2+/Na+ antiporter
MLRMHRLLAGLLGALVLLSVGLPAASAAPASAEMEWTVLDRFGGDADGDGRLDEAGPLTPTDLDVFAVRVRPSPAICADLETAVWRVDGKVVASEPAPGVECRVVLRVRGEGGHTVEVLANDRAQVARVEVDDKLIIAIGDSVAAGEGNPEGTDRWLDHGCHRSRAAGFHVAARRLAEAEGPGSVTFVSLACSGAEVEKGLLGEYRGIDPRKGQKPYSPQVERLRRLAAARPPDEKGASRVDAVLLSVGANDVKFSGVVAKCLRLRDCRESSEAAVREDLAILEGNYDKLGVALEDAAPGTPVLVTEYFDPTRDKKGEFCRLSVLATTQAEARWAYESLLSPLNRKIAEAAKRNDWLLVDGISADFERHGYCAKDERWVRLLTHSAVRQRDPWGTLHPSEEGHRAIAERVQGPLAKTLGFAEPPAPADESEDEGRPVWQWILIALAALLALAVLAFFGKRILVFLGRTLLGAVLLLRPTWPPDPVEGTPELPRMDSERPPPTMRRLLLIGLGIAVLFAAMIVLAGLVGRAILWLRFWSAHLPADRAVNAVSGSELVSTGSVALAIFIGLGLVAAAFAWLLDRKGRGVRTTRRGLVVIGLAEVLAALWIGEFRFEQAVEIFLGLLAMALLLHYLVERALELRKWFRERTVEEGRDRRTRPVSKEAWEALKAWVRRFPEEFLSSRRGLLGLLSFALLAFALRSSLDSEGTERKFAILAPYLGAALLFASPWGLAAPGVRWKEPETKALLVPRVALAATGFALIFILLVRDEPWLAGVAAVAIVLGLLCLAVANASKDRFVPYGLAILVSIPLFAGGAAFLRGLESPELQPVAAVLDNGEAVCGVYIGESDGELWLGRLVLDERAHVHRPRRGAIIPFDADRVEARALGPLEPVGLVEARASELRDRLLDERGDRDPEKRTADCTPPELEPTVAGSWQRDLAERHQPQLVLTRHDRFWPVPVRTLFSMRDRRASVCRRVGAGNAGCLRLGAPAELPWIGGAGESLEYPAADDDVDEQHDQMVEALGTADPAKSAAEYFLVNREEDGTGPISIQYWFFYPFNYQPINRGLAKAGLHEADFESVGVLLSARKQEPRYVWMARHNAEGRVFPWTDEALEKPAGRPRVYVARGSHASYESCKDQARPVRLKTLVIDDHPACEETEQLHLMPETTPLIDLSRVGWGCWQGLFGHRNGGIGIYEGTNKYLIADAPKSPLWQQEFGEVERKPCLGAPDPGDREGFGEEVVEEETGTPAWIRGHAGRLEDAVDDCADWEAPAPGGIYMVVCNQGALKRYVKSGLEDPGRAAVRIEGSEAEEGDAKDEDAPVILPAVRRNRAGTYLGDWRITAAEPIDVSVYASCPSGGRIVAVRFEKVRLKSGRPLRINDHAPGSAWLLTAPDGTAEAEATPFPTKVKDGFLEDGDPNPRQLLACGG